MLDVKSTTKGFLPPRMNTTQRDAIVTTVTGLVIFNTDCNDLQLFNGTGWIPIGNSGTVSTPGTITGNANPCINAVGETYSITALPGATGYMWTVPTGAAIISGQGTTLITVDFGTTNGAVFVSGYGSCWRSLGSYLGISLGSLPLRPEAGTHVPSATQIIWYWNAVSGATGYKWNTTDDYATATDMFTATTKTETGLTCNMPYTRYAWAYNACGISTAISLTQTTSACNTCGASITIDHIAGAVAPVTKTVTYGTVTNIPGETSKCWITSNLGASQQATAVNDATEASAGWYFQFNRSQGYQYISSRIPASTWTSSFSESSDWINANDPCNIELGTTWHIPTYTEWWNVDNTGGWTTWAGPWGSGLKLHAAGYLGYSDSSLYSRGYDGNYWSSTQGAATSGWFLIFQSGFSFMHNYNKANGFTLRCIHD
jgi:hypothetical protein